MTNLQRDAVAVGADGLLYERKGRKRIVVVVVKVEDVNE